MLRFFARTPGWGVEITSSGVRLALMAGRGADISVLHTGEVDLPTGLVAESYSSPNIRDLDALAATLRACLSLSPVQTYRAALSLPDGVFRVQTLEFDQLPAKTKDRERLIRWRLEKTAAFDISETVLRYQVLRQREHGFTVLACLIKQAVLEQYESVLTALGLEPWIVGLSSFHVLNFFSPLMVKKSVSALACLTDESFTTIVTEAGGARFYRYKEVKRSGADEIKARLVREIEDSLHFYSHMDRAQTSAVDHLYLAGAPAVTDELAGELRTSASLNVEILSPAGVVPRSGGPSPASALPVSMAAAMGAGSAL
jgi:Tfp pilus assembly PilM family ATPase